MSVLTLQSFRRRVEEALRQAYQSGDNCLIEALPASGKTYSTFKVAQTTDTRLLYLSSRRDLYDQAEDHCRGFRLTHYRLPTPQNDCPSFQYHHDEELATRLQLQYSSGISGVELHQEHDDLPCQDDGDCPYLCALDFDPSNYEVLIGNPKHAYNEEYLENRVVVKDEFSETEYQTCFEDLRGLVTSFVNNVGLPFQNYRDVLSRRASLSDEEFRQVVEWFDKYGLYRDKKGVLTSRDASYHVLAPAVTYAILHGHRDDLGNGWERTRLGVCAKLDELVARGIETQTVFVRNQRTDEGYLLRPPEFGKAAGFVGLDGTPTLKMWKLSTGLGLDHRDVLSTSEKKQYISNVLNHTIIQTNTSKKPYQNPRNVTPPKDTSLAFWIRLQEDEKPDVITSKKALEKYQTHLNGEFFEYVGQRMNFAQVRSSNAFEDSHLGLVIGSRHYGDEYIKRWGAYLGQGVKPTQQTQPRSRSYGVVGNTIRDHLYNETLQDVLRFGRDTQPTKVYVNTSALPSWVPTKTMNRFPNLGVNRRNVIQVLQRNGNRGASVAQLEKETDLSKAGARKTGEYLVQKGLADYEELEGHPNVFILAVG